MDDLALCSHWSLCLPSLVVFVYIILFYIFQGDSGGPLICEKMFRGIVSFGPKPCANPKIPGVYTFLTKEYIEWIEKEINKKTNAIN